MVRQACPEPDEGLTTNGVPLITVRPDLVEACPELVEGGERLDCPPDGSSKGER
jgi:hypothetical protein